MFHIDADAKSNILATAAGGGGPTQVAAFEPDFVITQPEAVTRVEIHLRIAGKEDEKVLALSEQLANTVGLRPRHMRRATDLLPIAAPEPSDDSADEPASTPLWHLTEVALSIDRSTPELRCRIGRARTPLKPAARLPPRVALPVLMGPVLVGACLGIGDLVFGW